jgi:hypothetical protein
MSDSTFSSSGLAGAAREEILSALFGQMVLQLSQMATMFLGSTPHPQTGESVRDLETARLFIDQLEMLEVKTKGNLSKDEERLLRQSLMSLRMAFVEAVESATKETSKSVPETAEKKTEAEAQPVPSPAQAEEDSKKKFSKKY